MRRIVYSSRAVAPFEVEELVELLCSARSFNAAHDITGMLVYSHSGFLQAVEGPHDAIETVWRRVLADPRHTAVRVLADEEVPIRRFPDWSMSFAHPFGDEMPGEQPGFNHEPDYMLVDPASVTAGGVAVAVLSLYARNRGPTGPGSEPGEARTTTADPPAMTASDPPAAAADPPVASTATRRPGRTRGSAPSPRRSRQA